jgi:hypothetical protein
MKSKAVISDHLRGSRNITDATKIIIGISAGRKPLEKPRRKWKDMLK